MYGVIIPWTDLGENLTLAFYELQVIKHNVNAILNYE
jgi:hypothetical protein